MGIVFTNFLQKLAICIGVYSSQAKLDFTSLILSFDSRLIQLILVGIENQKRFFLVTCNEFDKVHSDKHSRMDFDHSCCVTITNAHTRMHIYTDDTIQEGEEESNNEDDMQQVIEERREEKSRYCFEEYEKQYRLQLTISRFFFGIFSVEILPFDLLPLNHLNRLNANASRTVDLKDTSMVRSQNHFQIRFFMILSYISLNSDKILFEFYNSLPNSGVEE